MTEPTITKVRMIKAITKDLLEPVLDFTDETALASHTHYPLKDLVMQ